MVCNIIKSCYMPAVDGKLINLKVAPFQMLSILDLVFFVLGTVIKTIKK